MLGVTELCERGIFVGEQQWCVSIKAEGERHCFNPVLALARVPLSHYESSVRLVLLPLSPLRVHNAALDLAATKMALPIDFYKKSCFNFLDCKHKHKFCGVPCIFGLRVNIYFLLFEHMFLTAII